MWCDRDASLGSSGWQATMTTAETAVSRPASAAASPRATRARGIAMITCMAMRANSVPESSSTSSERSRQTAGAGAGAGAGGGVTAGGLEGLWAQ
ncbi:hypothetical protein GCM10020001_037380 [Nonomuraea salmonea]